MPGACVLRRLAPEHAAGVSELVARLYGDSYPRTGLYCPEQIVAHNRAGEWVSAVALDESGLVIGHAALEPALHGPIAEMGMSMVLPEHRRHGVLERLRDFLLEQAERLGLAGQLVEVGTSSPAGQAVANRSAARPCGLTLGLWPGSVRAAGADAAPLPGRLSFVRYFRYLRRPAKAVAHAPVHHRSILARIYGELGMPIELRDGAPPEGAGQWLASPWPSFQGVFLRAMQTGTDTVAELDEAHRAFRADPGLSSAYLELPLAQPGALLACLHAERLGFFFSGVTPWSFGSGDALRLQCLKEDPDLARLQISHPFARELAVYVAGEWERARGACGGGLAPRYGGAAMALPSRSR
jgi:GNAT superfamily N-acetyltransferase